MSGPMIMPMYSFYVYSLNRVTLRTGRVLSSPIVAGVDWVICPPESTRVALHSNNKIYTQPRSVRCHQSDVSRRRCSFAVSHGRRQMCIGFNVHVSSTKLDKQLNCYNFNTTSQLNLHSAAVQSIDEVFTIVNCNQPAVCQPSQLNGFSPTHGVELHSRTSRVFELMESINQDNQYISTNQHNQ